MSGRVLPFDPPAHKVADVLLPWFVNGTLDEDELAFVQQHLGECARCQREVEWLRELRAACADGEAVPGASSVFHKLGRQLDEPRTARGEGSWPRRLWKRTPPWSRWAMAAELALIVALGAALLPTTDGPPLYRTLGARNAATPITGNLVVVFDPTAIVDHATYADPHRYSSGVVDVFVNVEQVLRRGEHTGARPGRVLVPA